MPVGLIGLGNLGTAVANLIAANGHDVLGWEHDHAVVRAINDHHTNETYLPGVQLDLRLVATTDLTAVVRDCDVVFVALPSVFLRSSLLGVREAMADDSIIVNMTKGIDRRTGLTSFQQLASMFPDGRRVMLSGPSIANEFARGMPTVVVIAGDHSDALLTVGNLLDNDYFRTRFSDDPIGVELGGILKNIYAIGLGLFDGSAITSINFRAAYLTIALEEMARFGVGMGARLETFLYLSGMGDLLATSLSEHSHNRRFGELLASDKRLEEAREIMGVLPEGFNALQAVLYIAEKMHLSMPLAHGLLHVINGRDDAKRFITLFIRDFVEHASG